MRTLRFIVEGETIRQDPSCDFSGLFPGRNPDVKAEFRFSPEWDSRVKVAAFWSTLNVEYKPQEIKDNFCIIPSEALLRPIFKIQIFGKKHKNVLTTNKLDIRQSGDRR